MYILFSIYELDYLPRTRSFIGLEMLIVVNFQHI